MKIMDDLIDKFQKQSEESHEYYKMKIDKNINKAKEYIEDTFGKSSDLIFRRIHLKSKTKTLDIELFYIDGLSDEKFINSNILDSLTHNFKEYYDANPNTALNVKSLKDHILPLTQTSSFDNYGKLFLNMLNGSAILLVEGQSEFISISSQMVKERAIESPKSHISIKGPQDSFTENYQTNISLIRRRLKNPKLWVNGFVIGTETNTDVAMIYIKGTADQGLVDEVEKRLKAVEASNILDSSYLTYYIKDKQFSLFPSHLYDIERPDACVANLLEGRVIIIVDGTPFVLCIPTIFIQLFQSVDDFYDKSYIATFFRLLRVSGFFIALMLPAFYIAVVSMHSEILPFSLMVQIAAQRENLPFPGFVEAIILSIIYDILREATVRMPKALGSSIAIVGALVLGESIVQAGVVSQVMVVIVSLTAITTLILPSHSLQQATTVIKYIFIFLATGFGFFGITMGVIFLLVHLSSLRSFGVSYFSPIGPFDLKGLRDAIFRAPIKDIMNRDKDISEKYPH